MICCSPKAIKGLLSQLEFSFCLKDWCKGNYWREEEERTRQVVILNPNVYNILIARHVTVTFFLLFVGSAGVLARLRRETCAIDAGASNNNKSPQKGLRGALLYCSP
jgi:hypothetical protein